MNKTYSKNKYILNKKKVRHLLKVIKIFRLKIVKMMILLMQKLILFKIKLIHY